MFSQVSNVKFPYSFKGVDCREHWLRLVVDMNTSRPYGYKLRILLKPILLLFLLLVIYIKHFCKFSMFKPGFGISHVFVYVVYYLNICQKESYLLCLMYA